MPALLAGLVLAVLVLGFLAGPLLDRFWTPNAHPGALVACWLGVLSGTFVAIAGMTLIALFWPSMPGHGFLEWLNNCLPHHPPMAIVVGAAAGLPLAGAWCVRLARGFPRVRRTVRHRRTHREMLHLVAREHRTHPDVLVLDHPIPVAYCLPSRWRPIVLSTGAIDRLSSRQLEAVLAHERAHLRLRHHAVLLFLDLGHSVLPWLPTVRRARTSLPTLLEMTADDAAARAWGGRTLAGALRQVAGAHGPAGALGAAGEGGTLSRRLHRLESQGGAPGRAGRSLAWPLAAGAALVPFAAVVAALVELPGLC